MPANAAIVTGGCVETDTGNNGDVLCRARDALAVAGMISRGYPAGVLPIREREEGLIDVIDPRGIIQAAVVYRFHL